MLYQNLMIGIEPYSVLYDVGKNFPPHVHYELEFIFVVEGTVCAVVDGVQYDVKAGEVIGVGSMVDHSYILTPEKTTTLVVEFGPVFIGEKYKYITQNNFKAKVYSRLDNPEIVDCMRELCRIKDEEGDLSSMLIKSILYRLFALVAKDTAEKKEDTPVSESVNAQREMMSKVQNALNLVHHRYKEPITINEAASACGYGKSVFCKIFKNAVGVGFHQYLNAHRIEIAKYLLSETTTPIDCIADTVGYKDTKTFYRLFKTSLGMSPGEYRKKAQTP